jgi:hypothetical protein
VQVYYDEERTYAEARLHPYTARSGDQSGYVDFKAHPERILDALEDFRPFDSMDCIQTFYSFLRWVNGPDSYLETCDCALRRPSVHQDPNSNRKLSTYGRIYLMFRDPKVNSSLSQTDWLRGRLMGDLKGTDIDMLGSEGVVAFTLNLVIQIGISSGAWREDGRFFSPLSDPGRGRHLMLTFWAYGDDELHAFQNLDRVFQNIWSACKSVSLEIDLGVKRERARRNLGTEKA